MKSAGERFRSRAVHRHSSEAPRLAPKTAANGGGSGFPPELLGFFRVTDGVLLEGRGENRDVQH